MANTNPSPNPNPNPRALTLTLSLTLTASGGYYLTLHLTPDTLYCKYIKTGRLNPTVSPALGFTTATVDNRNDVSAKKKCNRILAAITTGV